MSNGLNSMDSIFQAFRDPVPGSGPDGSLTLPDLVRFLERHAPGYGVGCDVARGKFITVSLTINGTVNADDEVGALTREAVANIEGDVWEAYATAFLGAGSLWGLSPRARRGPAAGRPEPAQEGRIPNQEKQEERYATTASQRETRTD